MLTWVRLGVALVLSGRYRGWRCGGFGGNGEIAMTEKEWLVCTNPVKMLEVMGHNRYG
jgi:hypothetical protein